MFLLHTTSHVSAIVHGHRRNGKGRYFYADLTPESLGADWLSILPRMVQSRLPGLVSLDAAPSAAVQNEN